MHIPDKSFNVVCELKIFIRIWACMGTTFQALALWKEAPVPQFKI